MRQLFLLIAFFINFLSFSQDENKKLTLEFQQIVKEHDENIKALYNYRGAPLDWIETGEVSVEFLYRNVLSMYYKNVGILIYTYKDGKLYLSLLENGEIPKEHKVDIEAEKLQKAVDDVNMLFSTNFLNRAPKLRGSQSKITNTSGQERENSFKLLNSILMPTALDLERFEHLIIVPTFNIATLPFAAFKINGSFLIEMMSYSIAPNLFELALSNNNNKAKFNFDGRSISFSWEDALFVSNPDYPNNLDWDFPNLPGADDEVEAVIKIIKPESYDVFNGANAIKESIVLRLCDYDLIYFATHGISNSDSPMDHSFLVLADNGKEKSYLSLREIMNTRKICKLKADLVVLSACQTGLGRSHEGGVIGLARAFQIAGAQHVLMSLWNIDDKETGTMMKYFFQELKVAQELMPHEAFRQAILKYKTEVNDDPKYWAAFSIFGVPY